MKNYFPKNLLKKDNTYQKSSTNKFSLDKFSQNGMEKQIAEHNNIKDFIRTGLFSLSFVLLMAGAIYLLQNTVTVTSSPNGKELPIYCVDRDDNKVALSFDAAWAEGCLMELFILTVEKNNHSV